MRFHICLYVYTTLYVCMYIWNMQAVYDYYQTTNSSKSGTCLFVAARQLLEIKHILATASQYAYFPYPHPHTFVFFQAVATRQLFTSQYAYLPHTPTHTHLFFFRRLRLDNCLPISEKIAACIPPHLTHLSMNASATGGMLVYASS